MIKKNSSLAWKKYLREQISLRRITRTEKENGGKKIGGCDRWTLIAHRISAVESSALRQSASNEELLMHALF